MSHGIFKSRDGTPLYYERRGKGPPLVFCYGLTCRMEHWRHQVAHFSDRYEVILLDYRGHHRSGSPLNERNLTLRWCAHDVEDLITYLQLERVICLGHSFGVPVVLEAAHALPQQIRGTVLICGSVVKPFRHMFKIGSMDNVFRLMSFLYQYAPQTMSSGWSYFTKQNWLSYFLTARFGFNPSLSSEEDILSYLSGVHEAPFATFHSLAKDYNSYDGRAQLEKIDCPAVIISGTDDMITPLYLQEEMAGLLPNAEIHRIDKGSHNSHMDRPEQVNAIIQEFFKQQDFV